jgi:hypothetical protein
MAANGTATAANGTAIVLDEDEKLQIPIYVLIAIVFGLLLFGMLWYCCCCTTYKNKRKIHEMMQEAIVEEDAWVIRGRLAM